MGTIVELTRLEDSPHGTFGVLRVDKRVVCLTLEPPERMNAVNESAIPPKQYVCRRHLSRRFGETFRVEDVPGRTGILFHPGNTSADTQGCILLGSRFAGGAEPPGVLESRRAFTGFMERLSGVDEFKMTVGTHY